jgi:hypothetical protein
VLATLLPARWLRYSNRNVKCTTSPCHGRDDGRPTHSTDIIAIDIAVHTPPLHPTPAIQLKNRSVRHLIVLASSRFDLGDPTVYRFRTSRARLTCGLGRDQDQA